MRKTIRYSPMFDLWLIAFVAFVLYYCLALAKPSGIFWSLDEGGKLIYLENVLRTGDPRSPLIYPGRWLDSNLENVALFFYSRRGNEIYSWWAVGFPLLTLPLYILLGWPGLYILPALSGAGIVYITGKLVFAICNQSRLYGNIAALTVAFATPVAFYSTTFWEHTPSVFCLMGMVYGFFICKEKMNEKFLFLSGFLVSLSVFFRTESALLVIGFVSMIIWFFPFKKTLPLILGGMLSSALWMGANFWLMGNFLSPNANAVQNISQFVGFTSVGLKYIPYVLFNAPIISAFDLGKNLLIIGTLSTGLAFITGLFRKMRLLSVLFLAIVICICAYVLFQPSLYRSVHGLILICPMIIVSSWVCNTPTWKKYRWFWITLSVGSAFFIIGYIMRAWVAAGGLQWGPRYMLAFYPMLIIPLFCGFWELMNKHIRSEKLILLITGLFALIVSIGFEARGYITMYLTMKLYQESAEKIGSLSNQIIKTNCTWMPMVIPSLYWNGNVFTDVPNKSLEEKMKYYGKQSYLSVTMLSCSTEYIDKVMEYYQFHENGLIIEPILLEK